jgi:hypothetical protein
LSVFLLQRTEVWCYFSENVSEEVPLYQNKEPRYRVSDIYHVTLRHYTEQLFGGFPSSANGSLMLFFRASFWGGTSFSKEGAHISGIWHLPRDYATLDWTAVCRFSFFSERKFDAVFQSKFLIGYPASKRIFQVSDILYFACMIMRY